MLKRFTIYRKTVVIGAGYIAVELAGILGVLGSETHLLIRQNRVFYQVELLINWLAHSVGYM